jgi:hypothetical protein
LSFLARKFSDDTYLAKKLNKKLPNWLNTTAEGRLFAAFGFFGYYLYRLFIVLKATVFIERFEYRL